MADRAERQQKRILAGILIGLALSLLLFHQAARICADFDPANVGLGVNTFSDTETMGDLRVSGMAASEIVPAFRRFKNDGYKIVLWMGASQLHGLNQPRAGDRRAIVHANEAAIAHHSKVRYLQLSASNASTHELLAFYLTMRAQGLVPDAVLLAVNFDNFKEDYPVWKPSFPELPAVSPELAAQGKGLGYLAQLQEEMKAKKDGATTVSSAPQDKTLQQKFDRLIDAGFGSKAVESDEDATAQKRLERLVVSAMEAFWPDYRNRFKVLGMIEYRIQRLSTQLLKGKTRRRGPTISPSQIQWAMESVNDLIRLARKDGAAIALYRQPLRPLPTGESFYDRDAFEGYFEALSARCAKDRIHYTDLVGLVDAKHWGEADGGLPDFFHFQNKGHELLGHAVERFVSQSLQKDGYAVQ